MFGVALRLLLVGVWILGGIAILFLQTPLSPDATGLIMIYVGIELLLKWIDEAQIKALKRNVRLLREENEALSALRGSTDRRNPQV